MRRRWEKVLAFLCAVSMTLGSMGLPALEASAEEATLLKAGSISASDATTTKEQPFAAGTAGSDIFRIPCLISLKDEDHAGNLVAAADARYTEYRDFGGIDTIASVSADNGKTWNYSFPIYFPDSNGSAGWGQATTAIDPAIVEGPDGTIYCFADMNPTGITTFDIYPGVGTGFVEIDGVQRLALTGTYTKPDDTDASSYGDPADYEYYVGDFDENGFAPVLNKSDNSATEWGVDEWYNIYTVNANGEYEATLTQKQVNSSTDIQQNAFYADSVLHVYNTGYIWCVKSYDGGWSWEDPEILNTQIKRDDGNETALLVSPGQGMVTRKGDIIVGAYDTYGGENASIFYSTDNGKTWKRSNDVNTTSSENEIVELPDGTLRMFYRSQTTKICYADITRQVGEDGEVTYTVGQGQQTSAASNSNCNVSAILLEDTTIDGKPVILASNPEAPISWTRVNGKIFVFTLNEDNTMNHEFTYDVNDGQFAYSCMTELDNGNLGFLWEPGINEASAIRYDEIPMEKVIGKLIDVELEEGDTYVISKLADEAAEITTEPNASVATAVSELQVEDGVFPLHDYGTKVSNSLNTFSSEINTDIKLEEAEFTFNASGDYWQIYNEAKNVYLTNANSAEAFFSSSAADMKVTASTELEDAFTICLSEGKRYIIFYSPNMNFNSNTNFSANYGSGSYSLMLLEKQDQASEGDVIPGYKRVSSITDGKNYLITYIWSDGSVLVLYPTNGTSNQTKLVGEEQVVKTSVTTITAMGAGKTTVVVDGITYNISVVDHCKVYYSFDNVDGTTLNDEYGNHNGTINTSATLVKGKKGMAMSVNNAGEGAVIPDYSDFDAEDWSVSYWVKTTSEFNQEISVLEDSNQLFSLALRLSSSRGNGGLRVNDADGGVLTFKKTFEKDTWYHIVWTQDKDSAGISLYVDGTLVTDNQNRAANSWTVSNAVAAPFEVIGGTGFTGIIDEVKVYDKVLTAEEIAESAKDIGTQFDSASISLAGNIGVNFYAQINENDVENTKVSFKVGTKDAGSCTAADAAVVDGLYKFTAEVCAAEMTQDIYAELLVGDEVVDKATISVKDYADYELENSDSDSLKALLKSMLNYGAYSQLVFDKYTDDLANADLTAEEQTAIESVTAITPPTKAIGTFEDGTAAVDYVSLVLKSETALRFYLADGVADSAAFTVDGNAAAVETSGSGSAYVKADDIAAADLDSSYSLVVEKDDEQVTVTYSPLNYVSDVLESETADTELKNVVKALYLYNQAANTYFNR